MKWDISNVHIISRLGQHIVLDVETNSIHLLDEASVQVLKALVNAQGNAEALLPTLSKEGRIIMEELKALKDAGTLFTPAAMPLGFTMPEGVKSLCLNVAHDCNLACAYCFASQGNFGGSPALMTPEVGRKAVDFLISHAQDRPLLEMDFFGGEPLMAMDTVQEVVRYGRKKAAEVHKAIKFSLTTNGVQLNQEIRDFLIQNEISLVLSLDGRKEVNDRMRYTKNHKPSYDVIVPHFKAVSQVTGDYVVRGTYTRYNLDFSQDVKSFLEEGFDHLSVEPVVCSKDTDFALRKEDLPVLEKEYERLARLYLKRVEEGRPFDFFHFNVDLEGGPCLYKRVSACGAGFEYLAVTPEGDIYPCHQFVGIESFKMGTLDEGIVRKDLAEEFHATHVYSKEACQSCWARYHCSGGCHANAWEFNQNIKQPYVLGCEIQKIRLELAITVQVMLLLYHRYNMVTETSESARADQVAKEKIQKLLKNT